MLIVAVAIFNIVATLIMVVNDKRTDIAILRMLGLSSRGVLVIFLTRGVLIAALLLTVAATIYPALQAAKTQPAEALRYE